MPSTKRQRPRSPSTRLLRDLSWALAGALVLATGLFGYFLILLHGELPSRPWLGQLSASEIAARQADVLTATEDLEPDFRGRWPGIRLPPVRQAIEAQLADDAEVIGVCTGGQSRAYVTGAMWGPRRHVLNDVLGGRPISVTYCDRTDCSRVFTSEFIDGPLEMDVGGWVNRGLALRVGDTDYAQMTGECLMPEGGECLPYPEWPHVRTSWKHWRETHPDTDVCMDFAPAEESAPP